MKYEISDDLRKKALNNNADIERIASLAITDICKIVNVPDETCFQIDDSNLPLTNWARRDGNIVKIKISSFILNPVKIPRSVGCRKVDSIDYHERDCKCVYAITHEGAEPLYIG